MASFAVAALTAAFFEFFAQFCLIRRSKSLSDAQVQADLVQDLPGDYAMAISRVHARDLAAVETGR